MVLIYVTNDRLGEVADVAKTLKEEYGNVDYRNPRLFDKPNRCKGVFIHGDFPEIEKAYGDKVIEYTEYPLEKGAGWFELSDGSSVRGEEKAIEAQKELDNG